MAEKASSSFVWPPTIYGGASTIGAILSWVAPWPFVPTDLRTASVVAGLLCGGLGLGLIILAGSLFRAAGTPVPPTKATTAIVTDGIYRYTRNPMYLGMSLLLVGLGLGFRSLWFFIALPVAVFAVTKLAIEREEAYLAEKFGDAYRTYKTKVRRWL